MAKLPRKPKSRRVKCVTCGKVFSAERSTARYCSQACKQKTYRERLKY